MRKYINIDLAEQKATKEEIDGEDVIVVGRDQKFFTRQAVLLYHRRLLHEKYHLSGLDIRPY